MTTLAIGVTETRKINGVPLDADITLTPALVKAAPEGYGLGEQQPVTVSDANSDPLTWLPNGGQGWVRFISSTTNKPDTGNGTGILFRYQTGTTSAMWLHYMSSTGTDFIRRWNGTAWAEWNTQYTSANLPKSTGTAPITVNQTTGAIGITAATTTAAGSMSAADKIRLDAIGTNSIVHTGGGQTINGDSTFTGWIRTIGNTGWYSETHGGGWHMSDATWIRSYGGKNVHINSTTANALDVSGGVTVHGPTAFTHNGGYITNHGSAQCARYHSNTYAFLTSPADAHLCCNSYWNGANWLKMDNNQPSSYIVVRPMGGANRAELYWSDAGSSTPQQYSANLITSAGGTMTGTLTVPTVALNSVSTSGNGSALAFNSRTWGTAGRESVWECNFAGAPYMFYAQRTASGAQSFVVNGTIGANAMQVGGINVVTQAVLNALFPVGHMLLSYNAANPSTYGYPGTWALTEDGAVLMAVTSSPNSTAQNTMTKSVPVTAHTHTYSGTSSTVSNDHTHGFSATTSSDGYHSHSYQTSRPPDNSGRQSAYIGYGQANSQSDQSGYIYGAGAHTHTVSGTTGGISANHSHTYSGTTASTGTANATMDVTPRHVRVYAWVRTA